ncbi:hypothetical protein CFC21_111916 [Triticum aestivum]|uniref:Uncharacterized protein n=2 Tax=Triticum aestivum TaxID=4565 RepID=A0A3B6TTI9_WHEAT|nr:hypothetical protein CFC21_111916 [Triticum aestivum]
MKKKLYLLFFTVEGFEQVGEDTDGNDDDPDQDHTEGEHKDELGRNEDDKDNMYDDGDEAIDELDRANFPSKQADPSSSNRSVQRLSASAAEFHPVFMNDDAHDSFVEEIRNSGHKERKREEDVAVINTPCSYKMLTEDSSDIPMSVHLEYCSQ